MDEDVPGLIDEETGAMTLDEKADAVNYDVTDEIARRAWLTGARMSPRAAPIFRKGRAGGDFALRVLKAVAPASRRDGPQRPAARAKRR